MEQRLILCPPPSVAVDTLAAALRAGDVAAVVLESSGARLEASMRAAQLEGVAALVMADTGPDHSVWPAPRGADGLHLVGADVDKRDALTARPEPAMAGSLAETRHEAMELGETGADYLWFGDVIELDESALELAAWWCNLFEPPCVIAGPDDEQALDRMVATGAEFIATDVFHAADPDARVASITERLAARPR